MNPRHPKHPKRNPRNTQVSISLELDLKEKIKARAAEERRSISSYLCWLAARDIASQPEPTKTVYPRKSSDDHILNEPNE